MKYSLVNNLKVEPFPGGKGICLCCRQPTVSKCGIKVIHHWAHKSLVHCDNWWENETEWHRKWKSHFPQECQEIVLFDSLTGEKHIADVKTKSGIVIEFQNSPMSHSELKSRESFYKKIVWIVNGKKFYNNFHILGKLPNPKDHAFNDIAFSSSKKNNKGRLYWKYSENPDWVSEEASMVRLYNFEEIQNDVDRSYIGHHLYDWSKSRDVWFSSNSDVFIDFGDEFLWKMIKYGKNNLPCIKKIRKDYFIRRATGNKS